MSLWGFAIPVYISEQCFFCFIWPLFFIIYYAFHFHFDPPAFVCLMFDPCMLLTMSLSAAYKHLPPLCDRNLCHNIDLVRTLESRGESDLYKTAAEQEQLLGAHESELVCCGSIMDKNFSQYLFCSLNLSTSQPTWHCQIVTLTSRTFSVKLKHISL